VVYGRSFFANRVGEEVASPLWTLVDDPTDARHFAASAYDGEGLACRRNVLIESGRLKGFVYDTVSARRAGTASTGSAVRGGIGGSPSAGCRALQLLPGDVDQAELLQRVGYGIYVESLTGVHSGVNPISGDFSVGVTGLMIRNGELAETGSRGHCCVHFAADAARRALRWKRRGVVARQRRRPDRSRSTVSRYRAPSPWTWSRCSRRSRTLPFESELDGGDDAALDSDPDAGRASEPDEEPDSEPDAAGAEAEEGDLPWHRCLGCRSCRSRCP